MFSISGTNHFKIEAEMRDLMADKMFMACSKHKIFKGDKATCDCISNQDRKWAETEIQKIMDEVMRTTPMPNLRDCKKLFAEALLAAERRGMERAAEIAKEQGRYHEASDNMTPFDKGGASASWSIVKQICEAAK